MNQMHAEYIAYKGEKFAIEWFYDENGKSEVLDYYRSMPLGRRQKLLAMIRRMGDIGKIYNKTKFRHEGDQIYAFKPRPERFLCFFFTGKKIIITNAFVKKTNKLPETEKRKALECRNSYKQRIQKGIYYEKSDNE